MKTAGAAASSAQVSVSGSFVGFVDNVVKGLTEGASAWSEKRVREREEKSKLASPGSRPSPTKKAKAEETDAECRDLCVPLVVDMMKGGMQSAAVHLHENQRRMDERMTKIEKSSDDLNQRASTLENSHCDLEAKIDKLAEKTEKLSLENQALREELHVQSAWKPQPASARAQEPANSVPVPNVLCFSFKDLLPRSELIPRSERLDVLVGNLGYDTEKSILLARLDEVIAKATIDPSSYTNVKCPRELGSQVFLTFKTVQERQEAQDKLRAKKLSYPECSVRVQPEGESWRNNVYITQRRQGVEQVTSRIMASLKEAINDMESRIVRDANAATPSIQGGGVFSEWKLVVGDSKQLLVSVTSSQIRWSQFAFDRYSSFEQLDMVSEWAFYRAQARA